MSFSFMATNGQSAAVAAQYMLSGQQNQFCSGQHPAGHMVPSHCFLAAILTSFSFMATIGQSASVAAQYMLSAQQNQLTSGQHPAGHMVPSHCFMATNGQSEAVAAQYMLSGQQNQFCSGQHPAGHEVSSGPHCLFLAIFMSWAFLATKGQSAAVAAQYMLSGQQNQFASGQQPAGQEVSSGPHCLFLAIFMSR